MCNMFTVYKYTKLASISACRLDLVCPGGDGPQVLAATSREELSDIPRQWPRPRPTARPTPPPAPPATPCPLVVVLPLLLEGRRSPEAVHGPRRAGMMPLSSAPPPTTHLQ